MNIVDSIPTAFWDSAALFHGCRRDLFRIPIGQGESVFRSGVKTIADTNMSLAGQMPPGYNFITREIRAEPLCGMAVEQLTGLVIRLIVGSRYYTEIPASEAAARITIDQRMAGLLLPGMTFGYALTHTLTLAQGQAFTVEVTPADERPRFVRVALHGTLQRVLQ